MNKVYEGFHPLESEVCVYNRMFPVCFDKAQGDTLWDTEGRAYLDFLSCAGSLNYGHNPLEIKNKVIEYLKKDGMVSSLDLMTRAKYTFLDVLNNLILQPRGLDYKVQFTGPTGANAVEAALKIARLKTGRKTVVCFTNAFHGVSNGALAVTGNRSKRIASEGLLGSTFRMPFEGYVDGLDTLAFFEQLLTDSSSGMDLPAAIILETVQAEGGIRVASNAWLQQLASLAKQHDIPLIVDDIQTGCGRTGHFFSFEAAGIVPDIVCLSKSLGAMGFPLSIVLLKPEMDVWEPGQHNGTFRGNNLAFIAATAAIEQYWQDGTFEENSFLLAEQIEARFQSLQQANAKQALTYRGRGLIWGLEWEDKAHAARVSKQCFEHGLIVETCGASDQVLKFLPPLTISSDELNRGFDIIAAAIQVLG